MVHNGLTAKIENDLKIYHARRLPPPAPEALVADEE
jgi:glycerol-3-phosphate acyltransferase PlsX